MSKSLGKPSSRTARRISDACRRFARDRSGGTAIEYGLICSLIFLSIVAAVKTYGANVGIMYNNISGNVR